MIARDIMQDLREAVAAPPPLPRSDLKSDLAAILDGLVPVTVKKPLPSQQDGLAAKAMAGNGDLEPVSDKPRPLRLMLDELAASDPTRLAWPPNWPGPCDTGEAAACRALWNDVLRCALGDICRTIMNMKTRSDRGVVAVIPWIGGKDFRMVCQLAGLDAEAVGERVMPMLRTIEGTEMLYYRLFGATRYTPRKKQ